MAHAEISYCKWIIIHPVFNYADDTRKWPSRAATFCHLGRHMLSRQPYFKFLRSGNSRSQTLSSEVAISLRQCSTRWRLRVPGSWRCDSAPGRISVDTEKNEYIGQATTMSMPLQWVRMTMSDHIIRSCGSVGN